MSSDLIDYTVDGDPASTAGEILRLRDGDTGPRVGQRPVPKVGQKPARIDWRRWRACADEPVSTFVPEREGATPKEVRDSHRRAQEICATCPVITSCRQFGRENRFPYGVFGGETPVQRAMAIAAGAR